jgi:hypothetical protein
MFQNRKRGERNSNNAPGQVPKKKKKEKRENWLDELQKRKSDSNSINNNKPKMRSLRFQPNP